jgi:outer membrane immunogenic protein
VNKSALALAFASTIFGSAALAADLGSEPYYPAPRVSAPANLYDWSGFYAGFNVGYAFGDGRLSEGGVSITDDYDGWLGGLQVGSNWQYGSMVFGVEGDFQFTGIDHNANLGGGLTASSDLDFLATARGRIGAASDAFMPYVTAGAAFGRNEITVTDGVTSASDDNWHLGYAVGAGLEVAMSSNLTVRGEYLYVDLGKERYFDLFNADATFHIARVGMNYKF